MSDELIRKSEIKFLEQELPLNYLSCLSELLHRCSQEKIVVSKVLYYLGGFAVMFDGLDGDVVMHSGTTVGVWQSMGMPWDDYGVTDQDVEKLVKRVWSCLNVPADRRYGITHHVGMGSYHHEYFADKNKAIERAKHIAKAKVVDFDWNGNISRTDAYQFDRYGYVFVWDEWRREQIYHS